MSKRVSANETCTVGGLASSKPHVRPQFSGPQAIYVNATKSINRDIDPSFQTTDVSCLRLSWPFEIPQKT